MTCQCLDWKNILEVYPEVVNEALVVIDEIPQIAPVHKVKVHCEECGEIFLIEMTFPSAPVTD